jgi:hypothetical protein
MRSSLVGEPDFENFTIYDMVKMNNMEGVRMAQSKEHHRRNYFRDTFFMLPKFSVLNKYETGIPFESRECGDA